MITTGWECQGHSRAGLGLGLEDPRSKLFYELVSRINYSQTTSSPHIGYILDNVVSKDDPHPSIKTDNDSVRFFVGPKIVTDAARHNSHAHRYRAK